jgi:tetratricopeptide (TPR) repeat protein
MASRLEWTNYTKTILRQKRLVILVTTVLLAVAMGIIFLWPEEKQETSSQPLASAAVDTYRSKLPSLRDTAVKNPKDVVTQREYAVALYAVGKTDEAKVQYEKAIKLSPQDSTLQNNLGNVYRDLKKNDKAVAVYQKAIELNPRQINAYVNLANLQIYVLQKTEDGIATYKKAIENLPGNNEMWVLLGLAYEQKGDYEKAKAAYQTVLAKDPNNSAAKSNLTRLGI